jgi:hypothetical protein
MLQVSAARATAQALGSVFRELRVTLVSSTAEGPGVFELCSIIAAGVHCAAC